MSVLLRRLSTIRICNALQNNKIGNGVCTIKGWVKSARHQKSVTFINVNDGSTLNSLQVVVENVNDRAFSGVNDINIGCSVEIKGTLKESAKNGRELHASEVKIIGNCPPENYPFQKNHKTNLDQLRNILHLRPRSNTVLAVSRLRSALSFATHEFFRMAEFNYLHTPIITSSDCEGAGDMFKVTTSDGPNTDPAKEFFHKNTYLTVSGQLTAEAYALAMGNVYTFGPTFRAEKSDTNRHLAEFYMVEPEMAFSTMTEAMDNAENYIRYVANFALINCKNELDFFEKHYDKNVLKRLTHLVNVPFCRLSYENAVDLVSKEISKSPNLWKFPHLKFGDDLQTEHEKWLAKYCFDQIDIQDSKRNPFTVGPAVFVYNYPKCIKPFYMKDNVEDSGRTVNSFDLLVDGVGELVGGSQREDDFNKLKDKIIAQNLNPQDYDWYLDLRKYGSAPHSGYGLGFERLLLFITGLDNIRDVIPFPRSLGKADH